MVAVYVILGILAISIVYIVIKYSINTIKIKNKNKGKTDKKEEKAEKKDNKKDDKKDDTKPKTFEQKTEFYDESLKEAAMRKAFEQSKQKELEIKVEVKPTNTSELYDEENLTDLEKALIAAGKKRRYGREKNVIEQKHISSETNIIGTEGPIKKTEIESKMIENVEHKEIDVSGMTDDMKRVMISDILNKKY